MPAFSRSGKFKYLSFVLSYKIKKTNKEGNAYCMSKKSYSFLNSEAVAIIHGVRRVCLLYVIWFKLENKNHGHTQGCLGEGGG